MKIKVGFNMFTNGIDMFTLPFISISSYFWRRKAAVGALRGGKSPG
jgi:hypothetical protein